MGVMPKEEDTKKKKKRRWSLTKAQRLVAIIAGLVAIAAAIYSFWPDNNVDNGVELPDVAIIDAQFDAPGDDRDNLNGEWVQIKNLEDSEVDMSGWRLCDHGENFTYHFGEFELLSGATVKVFSGSGTDCQTELYWCSGRCIWDNDGDTAYLFTVDDVCVSEFSY
jgi:hypothetical protein